MKFVFVLIATVVLTVTMGMLVKNAKKSTETKLISPLVTDINASSEVESVFGWQVFVNNYYGYKIKHPSTVEIKNKRNGDVSLQQGKAINLEITQDVLTDNNTINTIMEKVIDQAKVDLKDKFTLLQGISPIALGSVTAETYSAIKNGENTTYYYVPQQDNKYLIITNLSPNDGSVDYLTSEDIIYSLELLP